MPTSASDFDVAKAVADQLKDLEKEHQQRILRWVAEVLGLDLRPAPQVDQSPNLGGTHASGTPPPHIEHAAHRHGRPTDIKSFVDAKQPKSDVQFATVVAYYYRFEAPMEFRRDSIDAQTLQEAVRLAGRRRPPKALATLNNAKKLGYLDSAERGQFRINSVGENLVAMTLPGGQTEGRRANARTLRSRKVKTRKR